MRTMQVQIILYMHPGITIDPYLEINQAQNIHKKSNQTIIKKQGYFKILYSLTLQQPDGICIPLALHRSVKQYQNFHNWMKKMI